MAAINDAHLRQMIGRTTNTNRCRTIDTRTHAGTHARTRATLCGHRAPDVAPENHVVRPKLPINRDGCRPAVKALDGRLRKSHISGCIVLLVSETIVINRIV